tara:strand:- start:316 stop:696 length:381 start_codon:yes stop_codon:yes gene_type:complete
MFDGMDVEFEGKKGRVDSRRIIELLSILESSPSDPNRVREEEPETFNMGRNKVAIVYNKILRFSGISVSDFDVAVKLRSDVDFVKTAYSDIGQILTALRPPEDYAPQVEEGSKPNASSKKKKVAAR